jgi:hypothetical protein
MIDAAHVDLRNVDIEQGWDSEMISVSSDYTNGFLAAGTERSKGSATKMYVHWMIISSEITLAGKNHHLLPERSSESCITADLTMDYLPPWAQGKSCPFTVSLLDISDCKL